MAASESCGSDDERILRVFEWAKKRGTHIHKNLSTGSFPIPGSGDPPKMVRGLMAQVSPCRILQNKTSHLNLTYTLCKPYLNPTSTPES